VLEARLQQANLLKKVLSPRSNGPWTSLTAV
jgi:hypothetical protein